MVAINLLKKDIGGNMATACNSQSLRLKHRLKKGVEWVGVKEGKHFS